MEEQFVLLWSQSQGGFHIERLSDMLKANVRAFYEDRSMDYVPLWIGTEDGCHKVAETGRARVNERDAVRELARQAIERARA